MEAIDIIRLIGDKRVAVSTLRSNSQSYGDGSATGTIVDQDGKRWSVTVRSFDETDLFDIDMGKPRWTPINRRKVDGGPARDEDRRARFQATVRELFREGSESGVPPVLTREIGPDGSLVLSLHRYVEAGGQSAGECLECGNVRESSIHAVVDFGREFVIEVDGDPVATISEGRAMFEPCGHDPSTCECGS